MYNSEFLKYLKDAKNCKDINNKDIDDNFRVVRNTTTFDKRLCYSLLKSIIMEKQKDSIALKDDRTSHALVPWDYIMAFESEFSSKRPDFSKEHYGLECFREYAHLLRYIQQTFHIGDNVSDVYAKVLCSNDELSKAIATAQAKKIFLNEKDNMSFGQIYMQIRDLVKITEDVTPISYFAHIEENKTKSGATDVAPGYGDYINPVKKRIIDRAMTFYYASDENGNINFDYTSRVYAPKDSNVTDSSKVVTSNSVKTLPVKKYISQDADFTKAKVQSKSYSTNRNFVLNSRYSRR
jgi:hypothetical protein